MRWDSGALLQDRLHALLFAVASSSEDDDTVLMIKEILDTRIR